MKKLLLIAFVLCSVVSFGQSPSGVDSAIYWRDRTPTYATPQTAKLYKYKYGIFDSGLSVIKKFFAYDTSFLKGRAYYGITADPGDSSTQIANTKYVMRALAGFSPSTIDTIEVEGPTLIADSLSPNRTRLRIVLPEGEIGYGAADGFTSDVNFKRTPDGVRLNTTDVIDAAIEIHNTVSDGFALMYIENGGGAFEAASNQNEGTFIHQSNKNSTVFGHTYNLFDSARVTIITDSLGTTQNRLAGLMMANGKEAEAGAQEISSPILWRGSGWKTAATAGARNVDFMAYVEPVQGTTLPSGIWKLQSSIAGGTFSDLMAVKSDGSVGIGTATPTEKLHVDGNGLFTGTLTATKVIAGNVISSTVTAADADFTAVSGTMYIMNTPTSAWEIAFLGSPNDGDVITFFNKATSGTQYSFAIDPLDADGSNINNMPYLTSITIRWSTADGNWLVESKNN